MRIQENVRLVGNLNRIRELNEAGVGANTISGLFKDHGCPRGLKIGGDLGDAL